MKYIDLTLPTPAENLACDEALLDLCEEGYEHEILRFWEPREHFVVLGYANKIASEVNVPACKTNQVSILRRCTGGGAVLLGPGCLNYSLVLKIHEPGPLQSITATNEFILHRHQAALSPLFDASIETHGHTDLAIGSLKFSGNSQRRKRRFLLFHGTFLVQFDLALVERALAMPSKQPAYRQNRSHVDFLMNVNARPNAIKAALQEIWSAKEPLEILPSEKIQRLARERYSMDAWNFKF